VDGPVQREASEAVKYQDLWAAVLFILHLGVMFWVALGPGLKSLRNTNTTPQQTYGTGGHTHYTA
jgi:hypothetical protein